MSQFERVGEKSGGIKEGRKGKGEGVHTCNRSEKWRSDQKSGGEKREKKEEGEGERDRNKLAVGSNESSSEGRRRKVASRWIVPTRQISAHFYSKLMRLFTISILIRLQLSPDCPPLHMVHSSSSIYRTRDDQRKEKEREKGENEVEGKQVSLTYREED